LDHFQSFYNIQSGNAPLPVTIGLKKVKDEQQELNAAHGWLAIWEAMEKNQGLQGVATVFDPQQFDKQAEDKQNNLIVLKAGTAKPFPTGLASPGTVPERSLQQTLEKSMWTSLPPVYVHQLK